MNVRQNGIYYTSLFNPFKSRVFKQWIGKYKLANETVLEPFAGANSIIEMLREIGLAKKFESFDLYPNSRDVKKRDTIKKYPKGYSLCITNPPWLYKSSAKRRGLAFPETKYDDLYKLCLSLSLKHNQYVGALIPASFVQSGLFHDRLERVMFLNKPLFCDTDNPVCLTLFGPSTTNDIRVYDDSDYIGLYSELKKKLPPKSNKKVAFNSPDGSLGFIAIDNNTEASIRFCNGADLEKYNIRYSSRSITRISGEDSSKSSIKRLNELVNTVRKETHDIFLTPFKGLRKDHKYRRRMEYKLAKDIINHGG